MSRPEGRYWFPAKRYGWGWGPPTAWQGWVVLIAWLATVVLVSIRLALGRRRPGDEALTPPAGFTLRRPARARYSGA